MKITKSNAVELSVESAAIFNRLATEFEITDSAGLVMLNSACECLDRISAARALIASAGLVIDSPTGWKAHPAAALERDARTQLHSALRLLKLDPEIVE
jgi:hypothetical protein